jgi:tol-pal system protein YbgF
MKRKKRMKFGRFLLAMAAPAVFGGCAMKGDIRTLQDEIRAIAARQDSLVAELRRETRLTQDTLRTQSDQMFDFRGDISRQLQQISQSLLRLEAIAGENQRGLASVRDQLANLRRLPATPPPATTPATDSSGTGQGGGGEQLLSGAAGGADELWNVAQNQLGRGSLNSASRAFEQFIADNPSDERVPEAHFFLADILVQQDELEEALAAFQEIQELFPTAPRVPDALYRIAVLQEELGDPEAAKATLERIMNTYPDAPIAMLARDKLREIGS